MGRKKQIDLSIYKGREVMLIVVEQYVKTKRIEKGKDDDGAAGYYFLCPFHIDRHPSFMVSRANITVAMGPNHDVPRSVKKRTWGFKCFGCGKGGDVYTFLKYKHGYSLPESIGYLKQLFPKLSIPIPDPNQLKLRFHYYETAKNHEQFESARKENKPPVW